MMMMVAMIMIMIINFVETMFQIEEHFYDYNVEPQAENGMATLSEDRWLTLHSQRAFQDR